ncbi:MAG TPA: IS1182 family transposase [Candidatus Acidoferrum sp.]|nr:IS1182 family transposase [Candidatus Acidoferrum sp.]
MSTQTSNPLSGDSSQENILFRLPPRELKAAEPGRGQPRVQRAERQQVIMRAQALDDLLTEDHQARLVWQYVEGLDLTRLYQRIKAVEGRAGREAIDPKILMALWLYATLDGIGSARQLDRLCRDHVAYQWICGGVSVNYHTLADFRTDHVDLLDELLTVSVASLMHQGLVTLKRVAQDGMRVRASAGAASFRREPTLQQCRLEAQGQIEALRKELEEDPGSCTKRQEGARQRAAKERTERIARALAEIPQVKAGKKADEKDKARASTTDPEARVMKMADGGFRPAHNVQFATDTGSQVITGVDVVNSGGDQGQMAPMVEQHQQRYGQAPPEWLADGGFAKKDDIEEVSKAEVGTTVYAPVQKPKKEGQDPHAARPDDSEAVAAWRVRMGTEPAKEIYKERASTAECVNAIARNRGLRQFLVRGLPKVRAVALWFALAHNLMRAVALGALAVRMAS